MREFSVGDAILAGFRLIGREPLAFLAWTLVYAVVGIAPQFLGLTTTFDVMKAAGAGGTPQAMAEAMAPLQLNYRLTPLGVNKENKYVSGMVMISK